MEVVNSFLSRGHHHLQIALMGMAEPPATIILLGRASTRLFVFGGIPSRREEIGLFPDAEDRPGDIYVTTETGCTARGHTYAAFDFTVHGAVPDSGQSNALLVRSCTIPGAAAHSPEKSKVTDLRRERERTGITAAN